jgi:hypothetical protein
LAPAGKVPTKTSAESTTDHADMMYFVRNNQHVRTVAGGGLFRRKPRRVKFDPWDNVSDEVSLGGIRWCLILKVDETPGFRHRRSAAKRWQLVSKCSGRTLLHDEVIRWCKIQIRGISSIATWSVLICGLATLTLEIWYYVSMHELLNYKIVNTYSEVDISLLRTCFKLHFIESSVPPTNILWDGLLADGDGRSPL